MSKIKRPDTPFHQGDKVIDDNGEIAFVTDDFISFSYDADGTITDWGSRIRYQWDQPSYGKTRDIRLGELAPLEAAK